MCGGLDAYKAITHMYDLLSIAASMREQMWCLNGRMKFDSSL